MPMIPQLPEQEHVFENDFNRVNWEFLRAYLVRHETQQRDALHALQKIANSLEKIALENRR